MENKLSSNGNAKLVGALLVGAAIGAGIGILFAPAKGSETRKKIMRKGEDLKDGLTDKYNDFMEDMKDKFESAKAEMADMMEEKTSK